MTCEICPPGDIVAEKQMIAIAGFHDRQRIAGAGFIRHVRFFAAGVEREFTPYFNNWTMILCVVDQILMSDDDLIRIDAFRQQRFDRFHGGRPAGVSRYGRAGRLGRDAGSLQNLLFLPLEAFRGRGNFSDDAGSDSGIVDPFGQFPDIHFRDLPRRWPTPAIPDDTGLNKTRWTPRSSIRCPD